MRVFKCSASAELLSLMRPRAEMRRAFTLPGKFLVFIEVLPLQVGDYYVQQSAICVRPFATLGAHLELVRLLKQGIQRLALVFL